MSFNLALTKLLLSFDEEGICYALWVRVCRGAVAERGLVVRDMRLCVICRFLDSGFV
jgi:hypothetical protein